MNLLNTIKNWFIDIGDFLHAFTNTPYGRFMKKYGPDALIIVAEVALGGGTGKEKRHKAIARFIAKIPEIIVDEDYASGTVKSAYEIWIAKQEAMDTDGDGVPDYRDLCKHFGKPDGGCVTPDGCPDSDCDGADDGVDKCPLDPACK